MTSPAPFSDDELEQLRILAAEATQQPLHSDGYRFHFLDEYGDIGPQWGEFKHDDAVGRYDDVLIVALWNGLPRLLASVEKANAERDEARKALTARADAVTRARAELRSLRSEVLDALATAERDQNQIAAVAALHRPQEHKVEIEWFHDTDAECDDPTRMQRIEGVTYCGGHSRFIEVCAECGVDFDSDGETIWLEFPCATARALAPKGETEREGNA